MGRSVVARNWKVRSEANINLVSLCDFITYPTDARLRKIALFSTKTVVDALGLELLDAVVGLICVFSHAVFLYLNFEVFQNWVTILFTYNSDFGVFGDFFNFFMDFIFMGWM